MPNTALEGREAAEPSGVGVVAPVAPGAGTHPRTHMQHSHAWMDPWMDADQPTDLHHEPTTQSRR